MIGIHGASALALLDRGVSVRLDLLAEQRGISANTGGTG